MKTSEIVSKLLDFKTVDKYHAFNKIVPGIAQTPDDKKAIVDKILDDCCKSLISLLETNSKPTKNQLKNIISECMYNLAQADIDTPNRDFGYELCWFLSDKVGLNMKRSSDNKVWGFWKVEVNEVKTISGIRKKRASRK